MIKYYAFVCALAMIFISGSAVHAGANSSYGTPLASYMGENGITIISYSANWKSEDKLQAIYEELLQNTHGNEMAYLKTLYIYPGTPMDVPKGFTSFYHEDYSQNKGKYTFNKGCSIEIFNGDQYTELDQIARIISHEYGHHFTFYYLMTKESLLKEQWLNSIYAKVRNLKAYSQVTYLNENPNTYSHEWDIAEILAEDYVQLYGSDLAKKTRDYLDVKERILYNKSNAYYYYNDFNLLPQENLDLQLAADVEGLTDYFYNLSGIKTTTQPESIEVKAPYLSGIHNVFKNYNEYVWGWTQVKALEVKNQYEYTLVINPIENNDYPIPLKTVYSGEVLSSISGSGLDFKKGTGILTNYEGRYEVRLFVKDRNGFMHASSILEINISPKDNSKIIFTDIPNDHWAIDYIYDLTNRDLVEGYSDETFQPENTISRAEFMTFLLRSMKDMQPEEIVSAKHWFVGQGYRDMAYSLGLLTSTHNNETYFDGDISRAEMAQMVFMLLKRSGTKVNINHNTRLTDVDQESTYMEISVVSYYQIIDGYPDQTFRPSNNATRAEAMKMISKYLSTIGQ